MWVCVWTVVLGHNVRLRNPAIDPVQQVQRTVRAQACDELRGDVICLARSLEKEELREDGDCLEIDRECPKHLHSAAQSVTRWMRYALQITICRASLMHILDAFMLYGVERCQNSVGPRDGRGMRQTSIVENSSLITSASSKDGTITKTVRKVSNLSSYVLRYEMRIR